MKMKSKLAQSCIILFIYMTFYLFWFFYDGVIVSADTQGYIEFASSREPLYPLFLAFSRFLFGQTGYLQIVVLLQCIIAAVAGWHLTMQLIQKLDLKSFSICVVTIFQFMVVLLCRFFAQRGATYCNEICSEGLAIPLFTLFLARVIVFAWDNRYKDLMITMCYAVLLMCTRKQMYITLIILFLVYLGLFALKKINLVKLLVSFLTVVSAFLLFNGIDLLYNFGIRGEFVKHTTDSSAIVITSFYCSDADNEVYFEDRDMRELFHNIITKIEEEEYSYQYADEGWMNLASHYANHYDQIAFTIVNPCFYDYIDNHYDLDAIEREQRFDEINKSMMRVLIPANISKIIRVACANISVGLCNTISKANKWLNFYNLSFMILYIGLQLIVLFRKGKKTVMLLSAICMVSTFVNAGVVGTMIFAQSRYMIYNMPFMYIGLYLLVREWLIGYNCRECKIWR